MVSFMSLIKSCWDLIPPPPNYYSNPTVLHTAHALSFDLLLTTPQEEDAMHYSYAVLTPDLCQGGANT
jgi:hypothetical protein